MRRARPLATHLRGCMQLCGVCALPRDAVCSLMFISHSLAYLLTTKITASPTHRCNHEFTTHRITSNILFDNTSPNCTSLLQSHRFTTQPNTRTSCSQREAWRNTSSPALTLSAATALTATSASTVMETNHLRRKHDHVTRLLRANVTVDPAVISHTTTPHLRRHHNQ